MKVPNETKTITKCHKFAPNEVVNAIDRTLDGTPTNILLNCVVKSIEIDENGIRYTLHHQGKFCGLPFKEEDLSISLKELIKKI